MSKLLKKRMIMTPEMEFETLQEAGDEFGITREAVRLRINNKARKWAGWYYTDLKYTENQLKTLRERKDLVAAMNTPQLHGERWAPLTVEGHNLLISDDGRVLRRRKMFDIDYWHEMPIQDCVGYPSVGLTTLKGRTSRFYIHRFMAKAFDLRSLDDQPIDDLCVNHLDGDKQNNTLGNIEVVSQKQNVRHYHDVIRNKIVSLAEYKSSRAL